VLKNNLLINSQINNINSRGSTLLLSQQFSIKVFIGVFENGSIKFIDNSYNGSNTNCNTSPKFVWSITPAAGFTISSGSLGNDFGSLDPNLWITGTSPLCLNFTQAGTYTITIKIGNRCDNDQITKTICIEPPLVPQFTLNTNTGCIPLTVIASNTTSLANQCSPPTYLWSVTYASGNCGTTSAFTYTNGTSATSANPSFNIRRGEHPSSKKVEVTYPNGSVRVFPSTSDVGEELGVHPVNVADAARKNRTKTKGKLTGYSFRYLPS
jgi:hypothetical protein